VGLAEVLGIGGIWTLVGMGILALEHGGSHGRVGMVFHWPSILNIGGYEVDEYRNRTWTGTRSQSERMPLVVFVFGIRMC